ncbi:MAG: hypothetical protein ACOYN4_19690 [Bacteroidales bacterium]
MTIQERIGQVVKFVYGTQANAARAMETDRQRINGVVNGVMPGLDFITRLGEKIEKLNLTWVILGRGPMFVDWDKLDEKKKGLVSEESINLERVLKNLELDKLDFNEKLEKSEEKSKLILEENIAISKKLEEQEKINQDVLKRVKQLEVLTHRFHKDDE